MDTTLNDKGRDQKDDKCKVIQALFLKANEKSLVLLCFQIEDFETSITQKCNFLKNAPDYIDPSGHFVFYEFL